jgi:hypothetical protein
MKRSLIGLCIVTTAALAQVPTHPIVIPPLPPEYTPFVYATVQSIPEGGGWYIGGPMRDEGGAPAPALMTHWLWQYTSDFNSGRLVATDIHPPFQVGAQLRYGACFVLTPPGATLSSALALARHPSTSLFPPAQPACAIPHQPILVNDFVTIVVN